MTFPNASAGMLWSPLLDKMFHFHCGCMLMLDSPVQFALNTAEWPWSLIASLGVIVARVVQPPSWITTPIPVNAGFFEKGNRVYFPSYQPRGRTLNAGTLIPSSLAAMHSKTSLAPTHAPQECSG
jgi:hypothetical protein